jgi:hypothetical protein
LARIEIYATPSTLYRYRPLSDSTFVRELNTILEKFVFCPLIKQMNDPMEGSHRESAMFRKSRFYEKKLAGVLEAKAKLGVASFSEVFDHEPMWAHYASNFTGICVAYSFQKLLKQLPDEYEFIRMTYSERPPVLLRSKKSPDEMAKLALSTKTLRWMTEREWRLIGPSSGKVMYKTANCVAHVYLGARIAAEHRKKLRRALKDKEIPVSEMEVNKYAISFRDLRLMTTSNT